MLFEEQKELRWIGSFGIPYIFDGEHAFRLEENNDGTTTLHHFERFRGILVPFLSTLLNKTTKEGFALMNEALKQRAEHQ
ncbi:MAG: SRPBCC domain-containing protein [Chitinophagaceae bacterium]|nr:SRPBCC domain-containing protein [Chitinophagaceae bacterium]